MQEEDAHTHERERAISLHMSACYEHEKRQNRQSRSPSRTPTYLSALSPVSFSESQIPAGGANNGYQSLPHHSLSFFSILLCSHFCEAICLSVLWGKSCIWAECHFFFLFLTRSRVVIFESACICWLPFRLSSGCPRWRLACTCHATCAVAAARSWRASLPSAPRTAAPRIHIHIHGRCTTPRRDITDAQ